MAARKPASSAKKPANGGKAPSGGHKRAASADLDRRWAILLFGLGLFFLVFAAVPGENGWAWARTNILFGAFGIGGWLLGPLVVWWAVLVSMEKPFFGPVIKGVLLLFALSGAALVFSPVDFEGLKFGEVLAALHTSGRDGAFGGGLTSLLLGASLLALCGKTAARVLLVLAVVIAVMVFAGVTPGDVVRFFQSLGDRLAHRMDEDEEYGQDEAPLEETRPAAPPPQPLPQPPPPRQPRRTRVVDVPLDGPAAPGRRRSAVDVPLGPEGPAVQPGPQPNRPVDIGPGGTFGKAAVDATEEYGLGDYVPLVPFNPYSREKLPEAENDLLLFGEHDPYAYLGGAQSKLPRGTLMDVEYIPPADKNFDLFHTPSLPGAAPGPARPPAAAPPVAGAVVNGARSAAEEHYVKPTLPGAPDAPPPAAARPAAGASGEPTVDELIEKAAAKKGDAASRDTREQDGVEPYDFPPIALFDQAPPVATAGVREEMKRTADLLVSTLSSFGVETRILDVTRGPSVTRYEVQPQAGVKISRITNLADDIALNLAAAGVRIEAPIPGKPAVGIEVPNKVKSTVSIRSILESNTFASAASPLSIALGKDIAGDVVVADLTRMPHLLIAGSTGSGKSVCVNSIIMSFMYKNAPEDVRMVLIDPKVVELAEYNGIPHLLIPVVTEPKQAAKALGQAVATMEQRYHLFAEHNVRDITAFNKLARRDGSIEKLPHIAIVIDELADLMMTAGKDVENYICRIAQKARAAGMHLIVATQRPSVDVITGLIKSNIPSRIAFAVSSQVDSRTILDGAGAEKLLGMGDMLFMPIGANKPVRVQGTYVKDKEISAVLRYVKKQAAVSYDDAFLAEMDKVQLSGAAGAADAADDEDGGNLLADATFQSAVDMALDAGEISTSGLQRRLRLGYARAGRIVDQMERMGIVSEPNGSKPRQVLISRQQWQEMVMNAHE